MSVAHYLNTLLQQGDIPFAEFMQIALYTPNLGYYTSDLQKLGQGGDFITAPELSPLFGYTIANQCQQILSLLPQPCLFELGAGSGKLCIDILRRLEALNCLPDTYYILEVSAHLRLRQQTAIQQAVPHLADKVRWLDEWPQTPLNGVIIANEVLDAMPVHRFLLTDAGIMESYVTCDTTGQLTEKFVACQNQQLLDYIQQHLPQDLPRPYLSEANLFLTGWIDALSASLQQGLVLLMDYGFPRHEYYHADRNQGTLMCHFQHRAHPDPLLHPGLQDITAHVDFTHVAEAGYDAGFHIAGYTNQASFLLSNGLLGLLDEIVDEKALFHARQAIKQLTQASEMGELFKIIALTKGIETDLNGFSLLDRRISL